MNIIERRHNFSVPVSTQGQVTLPKAIRERLGLKAGSSARINIFITKHNEIVIEPEPTVEEVFGMLKPNFGVKPANIYELREELNSERIRELGYTPKND